MITQWATCMGDPSSYGQGSEQGFICIGPSRVYPPPRIYSKINFTWHNCHISIWFCKKFFCPRLFITFYEIYSVLLRWLLVNPNMKLCLSLLRFAREGANPRLTCTHSLWLSISPAIYSSFPREIFGPDKTRARVLLASACISFQL